MIEIKTYECEFCGQVFEDAEECIRHEWKCNYEELRKIENCEPLRLFNLEGEEIKGFDCPVCDEIGGIMTLTIAMASGGLMKKFLKISRKSEKNLVKGLDKPLDL